MRFHGAAAVLFSNISLQSRTRLLEAKATEPSQPGRSNRAWLCIGEIVVRSAKHVGRAWLRRARTPVIYLRPTSTVYALSGES